MYRQNFSLQKGQLLCVPVHQVHTEIYTIERERERERARAREREREREREENEGQARMCAWV